MWGERMEKDWYRWRRVGTYEMRVSKYDRGKNTNCWHPNKPWAQAAFFHRCMPFFHLSRYSMYHLHLYVCVYVHVHKKKKFAVGLSTKTQIPLEAHCFHPHKRRWRSAKFSSSWFFASFIIFRVQVYIPRLQLRWTIFETSLLATAGATAKKKKKTDMRRKVDKKSPHHPHLHKIKILDTITEW